MINDIVEQVKLNPNQIPIPTTYRRNIEKVLSFAISFFNSFRFPLCEENQIIIPKASLVHSLSEFMKTLVCSGTILEYLQPFGTSVVKDLSRYKLINKWIVGI